MVRGWSKQAYVYTIRFSNLVPAELPPPTVSERDAGGVSSPLTGRGMDREVGWATGMDIG